MAQVEHIAKHASHQEERCARAAFAIVHGDQVGEAAPRHLGRRHCDALHVVVGIADAFADHGRTQGDGGRFEQHRDRELDPVCLFDHGKQPHRDQRVAAEVEEAVFNANLVNAQQFFPEANQAALHVVARGHVVAVQVRPLEFLTVAGIAAQRLAGLAHQGVEVHGRNDDMGHAGGQRTPEGVGTLGRANALRDVVLQLLFARGEPLLAFATRRAAVELDLTGIGEVAGREPRLGEPVHRKALDLHANLAMFVAQGDIEHRKWRVGPVVLGIAHPAPDARRQRAMHTHLAVGHRHPEVVGRVAGNQAHGPAGGQVEQRRMQPVALCDVALERGGQLQAGNALAAAKRHRLHHAPTRPEVQMAFLGRAPALRILLTVLRTTRLHRRQVNGWRRRQRAWNQRRLGVEHKAQAAVDSAVAARLVAIALVGAGQAHAQLALLAVFDFERPEEKQVVDGKRAGLAVAEQSLARQFEVTGAGQQRLAHLGAVAVENPALFAAQGGGEQPVPLAVKAGLIEKWLSGRLPRRRGLFAQALGHGCGGHANLVPDPPVDGHDPGFAPGPVPRIGVEVFVRCHVVHLASRRRHRAGRGEKHQPVDAAIGKQVVQDLNAVHLGGKNLFDVARGLGQQGTVINHAGGMYQHMNAAKPFQSLLRHRLHVVHIADVRSQHQHLGTQGLQAPNGEDALHRGTGRVLRAQQLVPALAGWQRAAREQHQPGLLFAGQPLGQRQADATETTGDQAHSTLGQHRQALGGRQWQAGDAQLQALGAPQRHLAVTRCGHQLFEHLVHQGVQRIRIGFCAPAGGPFRQLQVQPGAIKPWQFARRHLDRPDHGGLFGVRQRLVAHLDRARAQHGDLHRLGQVFFGHGLRQEQQAEKTLLNVAVKETAAGAEAFFSRHQPGMHHRLGRVAGRHELAHQLVVALAPAFRGQQEIVLTHTGEHVAGADHAHPMTRITQPRDQCLGQPRFVGEHQPVPGLGAGQLCGDVNLAVGRACSPARLVAPAGHVIAAKQPGLRGRCRCHTRFNEIGFALKGVGGQGHTLAAGIAPDRLPVHLHAVGPETPKGGEKPDIVGHHVFGMAQGVDHLRCGHAVGLAE